MRQSCTLKQKRLAPRIGGDEHRLLYQVERQVSVDEPLDPSLTIADTFPRTPLEYMVTPPSGAVQASHTDTGREFRNEPGRPWKTH